MARGKKAIFIPPTPRLSIQTWHVGWRGAGCVAPRGSRGRGKRPRCLGSPRKAQDDQLAKLAKRIQARALRRCGELLRQIPADKGGRPSETQEGALPSSKKTRKRAAADAGLSERQRKTGVKFAGSGEFGNRPSP